MGKSGKRTRKKRTGHDCDRTRTGQRHLVEQVIIIKRPLTEDPHVFTCTST
jgi:hypothetical protein